MSLSPIHQQLNLLLQSQGLVGLRHNHDQVIIPCVSFSGGLRDHLTLWLEHTSRKDMLWVKSSFASEASHYSVTAYDAEDLRWVLNRVYMRDYYLYLLPTLPFLFLQGYSLQEHPLVERLKAIVNLCNSHFPQRTRTSQLRFQFKHPRVAAIYAPGSQLALAYLALVNEDHYFLRLLEASHHKYNGYDYNTYRLPHPLNDPADVISLLEIALAGHARVNERR